VKLAEVQVGGRYRVRVSGSLVVVRVVEIKQVPPAPWARGDAWRTLIIAINEATGRQITIRSARRLRSKVED